MSLKVTFDLLHEIAFPSSLILLSFLYFDVFMYTYVRCTRACKYYLRTVCTEILTSSCNRQLGLPHRMYIYICMYIHVHVYFYIYGAIKVQVNRGGGLHGSAASKFCESYAASENAHYTIPKPKPHASIDFLHFFLRRILVYAICKFSDCELNARRYD